MGQSIKSIGLSIVQSSLLFIAGLDLHIFFKSIPGATVQFLTCQVTDSDLSEVRIRLTKDGVPLTNGLNLTGPRPNGDGTAQMRLQVETTLHSSRGYQCEVYSKTTNNSVVLIGKISII